MAALFSSPKTPNIPAPTPPPPAPTIDSAEAQSQDAADALRRRRGRAATILTGNDTGMGGGTGGTPAVGTKALLGG